MKAEFIDYDGGFPNLCSGTLIIKVIYDDETERIFGGDYDSYETEDDYYNDQFELVSGGSVWFTDDWDEQIESGPWSVYFPKEFPKELHEAVIDMVNEEVPEGCCGGCV